MEVITFGPNMDLSSKKTGDVFRLKLYGIEYDVKVVGDDELYHHVLDKFGWAWRDPKYKSETELCAMLKWVKEKGLTIEELSI